MAALMSAVLMAYCATVHNRCKFLLMLMADCVTVHDMC